MMWVKLNELQMMSGAYFEKEAAGSLLQQVTLEAPKLMVPTLLMICPTLS